MGKEKTARQKLREYYIARFGGVCVDCKQSYHFSAMDFDHKDPKQKAHLVSSLFSNAALGDSKYMALLEQELAKCELRCANCHRIKTWRNKETLNNKTHSAKKKGWLYGRK